MGVRDHVDWRFSGLGLYVSAAILLKRVFISNVF